MPSVTCPQCLNILQTPERLENDGPVRCPKCAHQFRIIRRLDKVTRPTDEGSASPGFHKEHDEPSARQPHDPAAAMTSLDASAEDHSGAVEAEIQLLLKERAAKLRNALADGVLEQHEYATKCQSLDQVAQKVQKLRAALSDGILEEHEHANKLKAVLQSLRIQVKRRREPRVRRG